MSKPPVKERGIMYVANMVNAILRGLKTKTRRVAAWPKEPFPADTTDVVGTYEEGRLVWQYRYIDLDGDERFGSMDGGKCPYGKVGDILWVRETWSVPAMFDEQKPSDIDPRAAGTVRYAAAGKESGGKIRPALFMPRWASRIRLDITEIRVEPLQDITEEEARAEGVAPIMRYVGAYRDGFVQLWDGINGGRSGCRWEDNPWVWVITFRRLSTTGSEEATA